MDTTDRNGALRRLHEQCAYETRIASRLRNADRNERLPLYGRLADEYARHFPEHLPADDAGCDRTVDYEIRFLRRFLRPDMTVAEVGPGRGRLAFALAPFVAKVYGVYVSEVYLPARRPPNFEFRMTDGLHMPFASDSLDLLVSNQLMEHLHPDDAVDQLQDIHRVLKPGCSYVCVTPSPVNGPHDCSAYFDDIPCPIQDRRYVATGLHLKEYTSRELTDVFRRVGFRHAQPWIGARGRYIALPTSLLQLVEDAVQWMPPNQRKRSSALGVILGNRVIATK